MPATSTVADPLVVAPAPWGLKGQAWILPFRAPNGTLPEDSYPAHERGTPYADESVNGKFSIAIGAIVIVRYTETDVGPYDEVMFIPGGFKNPVNKATHPRITTIYVSTEASVRNGRQNWGIPKYLADFSFKTDTKTNITHLSVSLPGEDTPFFRCTLKPARLVPSVPISKVTPLPSLLQPPIPPPSNDSSMLRPCPDWMQTSPKFGGWLRLVWAEGGFEGGKYGDGEAFPGVKPKKWGFEFKSFYGDFPVGKILEGLKKDL